MLFTVAQKTYLPIYMCTTYAFFLFSPFFSGVFSLWHCYLILLTTYKYYNKHYNVFKHKSLFDINFMHLRFFRTILIKKSKNKPSFFEVNLINFRPQLINFKAQIQKYVCSRNNIPNMNLWSTLTFIFFMTRTYVKFRKIVAKFLDLQASIHSNHV